MDLTIHNLWARKKESAQTKGNSSATNYFFWAWRLDAREHNDAQVTFTKRRLMQPQKREGRPSVYTQTENAQIANYKGERKQRVRQHMAGMLIRPPRECAKGSIQSLESRKV